MNKSDAERMFGMLEHIDYTQTEDPKEADLLIINTCSIRKLSEDKAYSQIGIWGKWKKNRPNIKIGFSGCVAQQVKEDLNNIWDRYYKVDKEHKRHHIGSGIGLSLAKQLIEAHGMDCGVESLKGEYSEFWFEAKEK